MTRLRRAAALASLAVAVQPAVAASCADPRLSVLSDDPALTALVCALAETALDSLASCNVDIAKPVSIDIVTDLLENCVGIYHCGTGQIHVLHPDSLAEVRRPDSLFAPLGIDSYFASIITHELAHVAHDTVPCPYDSCITTDEYVAYAMQVRSLSANDRALIIPDPTAPSKRNDISQILLFMAPDRFARNAWLHFSQRLDPCGYVGQIQAGDIRFDFERP